MNTSEVLDGIERCMRVPWWAEDWVKNRLTPQDMLEIGLKAGLTVKSGDFGMEAGETLFALGATHQIESKQHDLHAQVVHLASLADIVTTAIRKPTDAPWGVPESVDGWDSSCFLSPDGSHLRKVVFVSSWSPDRHYSLCRAWGSLGEVCHLNLPLHIVVVMLGKNQDGRYRSFWTRALRHPVNKQIRFRKQQNVAVAFKASWVDVWREDHDEYTTQQWLEAMLKDDVLRDVLFRIDVPVPDKVSRQQIIDLANRKLDNFAKTRTLPDKNLSTCDWPSPCVHRKHCHANEEPSGRYGFVPVDSL